METHIRKKQHLCKFCGQKYKYENALIVHVRTVHDIPQDDVMKVLADNTNSSDTFAMMQDGDDTMGDDDNEVKDQEGVTYNYQIDIDDEESQLSGDQEEA